MDDLHGCGRPGQGSPSSPLPKLGSTEPHQWLLLCCPVAAILANVHQQVELASVDDLGRCHSVLRDGFAAHSGATHIGDFRANCPCRSRHARQISGPRHAAIVGGFLVWQPHNTALLNALTRVSPSLSRPRRARSQTETLGSGPPHLSVASSTPRGLAQCLLTSVGRAKKVPAVPKPHRLPQNRISLGISTHLCRPRPQEEASIQRPYHEKNNEQEANAQKHTVKPGWQGTWPAEPGLAMDHNHEELTTKGLAPAPAYYCPGLASCRSVPRASASSISIKDAWVINKFVNE